MQTISTALPFDELVAQIQRQKETQGVVSDELMELYKDYLMVGLFNGQVMGGWFSKESQFGLSAEAGIPDSSAVYMGGREIGKKSDLAIGTTSPEELNQKAAEAVGTAKETIEGTVANMTIGERRRAGRLPSGLREMRKPIWMQTRSRCASATTKCLEHLKKETPRRAGQN